MWRRTVGFLAVVVVAVVAAAGLVGAQPPADRLITATSMGDATLGGTDADIAAALGAGYAVTADPMPFVDLEGFEVSEGGDLKFWALHVVGEGPELNVFITENEEYQLDTGVGPGTTIADAAAIYGEPTVSFNTNFESREFVEFAGGPGGRIQFQVSGPVDGETAGNYDEPLGEFNETTDIKPDSVITRVWISCVGSECPTSGTLPDTGLGDAAMPLAIASAALALGGALLVVSGRRHLRRHLEAGLVRAHMHRG